MLPGVVCFLVNDSAYIGFGKSDLPPKTLVWDTVFFNPVVNRTAGVF
jgi:hypothetical protein